MGISKFESGQAIVIDDALFTMNRKLPNGQWQVEDQTTGELRNLTMQELERGLLSKEIRFALKQDPYPLRSSLQLQVTAFQTFDNLPERKKKEAQFRLHFVRAVMNAGPIVWTREHFDPIIEGAWARVPRDLLELRSTYKWVRKPNGITVYRWLKRFLDGGQDILALVARVHLRGSDKRRTSKEVLEIIEKGINAKYMQLVRGTIKDALDWAISEICRENKKRLEGLQLKIPGLALVRKLIHEIPFADRLIARYGVAYARRKLRHKAGHWVAERILEYVQLDATRFDCMVLDDESLLPLGRPWITVAIDLRSRCVHGIYIGFTPPSVSSVFACLKHGFLPKADLKDKYPEIDNSWDCHGVMEYLVLDNGMENHSAELTALADRFNVIIQYCPRKQPWFKPQIERFIGTLNRAVGHKLPGTTFSNFFEKDDYDSEKHAVITLSGLRKILYKWIADVYHQSVHRTLHDTPANVWRESPGWDNPYVPDNPFELNMMFNRSEARRLTHKGIEIFGLEYQSDELKELRHRYGAEMDVTIRYDEENIGAIYVERPGGPAYVRVPAPDSDYAEGLSLWQHKMIRRYARKYKHGKVNLEALVEAKREIGEIIENEFKIARGKGKGGAVARYRTTKAEAEKKAAQSKPDSAVDEVAKAAAGTPEIPSAAPQTLADREREIRRHRQQSQQPPTNQL